MSPSPSQGFPGGAVIKESSCQCRRNKRGGFDSWVEKIPWSRKWQPTPVFLPEKATVQGLQRIRHNRATAHAHTSPFSAPSTFSSSTLSPFTLGQYFHDLVQSMFPPTFCWVETVGLRGKATFLRDQLNVLNLHCSARKLELTEAEWFSHRHQT